MRRLVTRRCEPINLFVVIMGRTVRGRSARRSADLVRVEWHRQLRSVTESPSLWWSGMTAWGRLSLAAFPHASNIAGRARSAAEAVGPGAGRAARRRRQWGRMHARWPRHRVTSYATRSSCRTRRWPGRLALKPAPRNLG